jgi:lysophospholipase L1-like esterase
MYYLSLGDSLAYGYQQQIFLEQEAAPQYDPAAFIGYAGFLTHRLGTLVHGRVVEVNYGCPGETTSSLLTACVFTNQDGAPITRLHDPYPKSESQMTAAEMFLSSHQGHVVAVTVDLGSNDLLHALSSCLSTPGCDLRTAVAGAVASMLHNLATIVGGLEAADPGVHIGLANFYNPEVDNPLLPGAIRAETETLVAAVNEQMAVLVDTLATGGIPITLANAYGAINGGIPGLSDAQAVCILTNMCTLLRDIHPTTAGYTSLSRAFLSAIEG